MRDLLFKKNRDVCCAPEIMPESTRRIDYFSSRLVFSFFCSSWRRRHPLLPPRSTFRKGCGGWLYYAHRVPSVQSRQLHKCTWIVKCKHMAIFILFFLNLVWFFYFFLPTPFVVCYTFPKVSATPRSSGSGPFVKSFKGIVATFCQIWLLPQSQ